MRELEKIQTKTIAVIGDLILDRYTYGQTKRISPEAPVPVLFVSKEEEKAGGAGNVALNLRTLGMNVKLMGRLGQDEAGDSLLKELERAQIDCSACLRDPSYLTSVKTRFIASSQQLLRVDKETVSSLSPSCEAQLFQMLDSYLADVDIVAISDYAKGLLTNRLLSEIIAKAKAKNICTIVDPKGSDFSKYRGADIIKPNKQEALLAVPEGHRDVEKAALWMLSDLSASTVMITRSEEGITLCSKDRGIRHFPVHSREVRDGTGAGDTVLAFIAAALASHVSIDEAVRLANVSASIAIERVGCAQVSREDVALRLLEQNPTGKIISWTSFQGVHSVFNKDNITVFEFPTSHDLHISALKRLRVLATALPSTSLKIALFPDKEPEEHTLELVAGLDCIQWVVYGEEAFVMRKKFPLSRMVAMKKQELASVCKK